VARHLFKSCSDPLSKRFGLDTIEEFIEDSVEIRGCYLLRRHCESDNM
jgi:hypothetical protein